MDDSGGSLKALHGVWRFPGMANCTKIQMVSNLDNVHAECVAASRFLAAACVWCPNRCWEMFFANEVLVAFSLIKSVIDITAHMQLQ